MTFGERLAAAMRVRGLEEGDTALARALTERAGHLIRPSTAQTWLKDRALPNGRYAILLAETLDISLDWLFLERGPMDPVDMPAYEQGVADLAAAVADAVAKYAPLSMFRRVPPPDDEGNGNERTS